MIDNEETQKNEEQKKPVIWNIPNILTFSRMLIVPVFVALFYVNFTGHFFVCFGLFVLASVTDLLDGAIARKHNLVTNLGKFLDPIADKVLVLTGLVLLLTAPQFFNHYLGDRMIIFAGCGVAIIVTRELIVSGFRMVAASSGEIIAADRIGKYKTLSQSFCLGFFLFGEGLRQVAESTFAKVINLIGLSLFGIAIILTIVSGVNYLVKNIHILKK